MTHELLGERFLSRRQPAWHGLGLVIQEEVDAREALRLIGGFPKVTLNPCYINVDGTPLELPNRSITRHPIPEHNEYESFGVVGPRYELVTLEDITHIWDAVVGKPIETIGILKRGANAFITSKLPAIDVKGDEIDRYAGVTTPLDGIHTVTCEEWDIRVVCQNTLSAAQAQAKNVCRVIHDSNAKRNIAEWLKESYARAEANSAVIKEAFEVLASKQINDAEAASIFQKVYPKTSVRPHSAPTAVLERRMALADAHNKRAEGTRNLALELFMGAGTGMDTRAAKGTLWGAYNAAVEVADYRKGTNRGGRSEMAQVAEKTMFGDRRTEKERAFTSCMEWANDEFEPAMN